MENTSNNIYQTYDKIIHSTLLNINAESKDGKIFLRDFNRNNVNHLYFFEIAKISQTFWNFQIVLDMPLLKYLRFKFSHRKLNIRKMKKKDYEKGFNIEKILNFIQESFKAPTCIFSNIYYTYYKKENKIHQLYTDRSGKGNRKSQ